MIYFDSAYLAKCYLNEPQSELVVNLAGAVEQVATCEIARLELSATRKRHVREGRIVQDEATKLWSDFEADERNGAWTMVPVTSALLRKASTRVLAIPATMFLRSADALHLLAPPRADSPRFTSTTVT
jgi:predicted nucleic acid-binding protein